MLQNFRTSRDYHSRVSRLGILSLLITPFAFLGMVEYLLLKLRLELRDLRSLAYQAGLTWHLHPMVSPKVQLETVTQ